MVWVDTERYKQCFVLHYLKYFKTIQPENSLCILPHSECWHWQFIPSKCTECYLAKLHVHFPLFDSLFFRLPAMLLLHLVEAFPVCLHLLGQSSSSSDSVLHGLLWQNCRAPTLALTLSGNLSQDNSALHLLGSLNRVPALAVVSASSRNSEATYNPANCYALFIYWYISTSIHMIQCRKKTELLLLHVLHLFNGLFSRTTWVSRYQKGKTVWI